MEHDAAHAAEHAAHAIPFLKEALIFLVAAGVVVPILQRIGLNPILGYLLAGIAVGPFGIVTLTDSVAGVPLSTFTIDDVEGVSQIAELGVVFLLFLIGLELSAPRLWAMRRLVFGFGGAQVVVTAVVIAGAALLVGQEMNVAVAIGASLALSSTAIVVQLLVASGRFGSPAGQSMFAVLLMQDIAVVPVLLLIGALAASDSGIVETLAFSIGAAAVIIPAIILAGRVVIDPVFRFIGARRDRDMFTAAALLVIIGTAAATANAGLSMALGAFLAGLVFADTAYSHQLEAEVAPFKGLLLGLFFMSVGMIIDPRILVEAPLALIAVLVGIIAIKALVLIGLALCFRLPRHVAVETGLMLSQIGEFSLVGLTYAAALGVVPDETAKILVVAAGITMGATTAFSGAIHRFAERFMPSGMDTEDLEAAAGKGHAIIAGYGRIGKAIAGLLDEQHIPYVAIDLDSKSVSAARTSGFPVYYGDVRRVDVLRTAHAADARVIVLTMDSPTANAATLQSLRLNGITTPVIARARDAAHARELYTLGAEAVVLEAFEASMQMGEEVLSVSGLPREAAQRIIGEKRDMGREELSAASGGS